LNIKSLQKHEMKHLKNFKSSARIFQTKDAHKRLGLLQVGLCGDRQQQRLPKVLA